MQCKICKKETTVDWLDGNDFVICESCKKNIQRPLKENELKHTLEIKNDPERKKTKKYLIATNSLFLTLGILSIVPSLMSAMIFDAPGSQNMALPWIIFICFISFFPMCLLSILFSLGAYSDCKYKFARIISLLPLINIFLLVIILFGGLVISLLDKYLSFN